MNTSQNHEQASLSFGRYLKSVRVEKRISLQDVAKETRIGLSTLILIENEDLDNLPAEVFMKGFIRAYAKVVGADGDVAVRRYVSDFHTHRSAAKSESDLYRSSARYWPRLILAFCFLGCIIALSVYVMNGFKFFDPEPSQTVESKPAAVKPETGPKEASEPAPEQAAVDPAEKLLLKVVAVKETWMKVIIDGQDAKEYKLNIGDRLELEAMSGFNLLLGDARGVELTLGEKPYTVSGKDGQVVTVQIP